MNTPVTARNTPSPSPVRTSTPRIARTAATILARSHDLEKNGGAEGSEEKRARSRSSPASPTPAASPPPGPAPLSLSCRRKERRRRAFARINPSLTLVNNGSVARDHLASERTFLAYVRTSVAFASMGVGEFPMCCFALCSYLTSCPFRVPALVQLLQLATTANDTKSALLRRYGTPVGALTIFLGLITLVVGTFAACSPSPLNFTHFIVFQDSSDISPSKKLSSMGQSPSHVSSSSSLGSSSRSS